MNASNTFDISTAAGAVDEMTKVTQNNFRSSIPAPHCVQKSAMKNRFVMLSGLKIRIILFLDMFRRGA